FLSFPLYTYIFLPIFFSTECNSCGGLFSSPSGTLQTPFYPRSYPNNANCVWEIEAKNNFLVTLSFGDNDYIEIYDGPLNTSPLLGRVCSSYGLTYTSSSNFMAVRFHSDSRYSGRGFHAQYQSIPTDHNTSKFPFCL
uniref:CUB domain-containing protein n=1 Tax=Strigops habroptila TaxID=2489341 RepID=A0A672TQU9_STRHB